MVVVVRPFVALRGAMVVVGAKVVVLAQHVETVDIR